MDLYSPIESASAVIEFLSNVDSAEAARAAVCYAPLLHLHDPHEYGAAVTYGRMNSLASAVREQFQAVQRIAERSTDDSQTVVAAAAFEAAQNAGRDERRGMLSRHVHVVDELMEYISPINRAIGVIYRPQTERQSPYFESQIADQLDAVIDFERTRAVEPLLAEKLLKAA